MSPGKHHLTFLTLEERAPRGLPIANEDFEILAQ